MKAIRIHEYGGYEVLHVENIPLPEVGAGEVHVRVRATSINPVDWAIRSGYLASAVTLPLTLGWDVAGDVDAVDAGVTHVNPGDAVFAMIMLRGGAFAEYAVVKAEEVVRRPATLDYQEAAAVPLVALTAWQALEAAQVSTGQSVLVHGSAGGVGSFAVQLARVRGARVIATASARNQDVVRDLGASEVIDYNAVRFEDSLHRVDAVIDTVGGEVGKRSLDVLKPGGVLISLIGTLPESERTNVQVKRIDVTPNAAQLQHIADLIDKGQVKPIINTVLSLDQVAEGLRLNETGHGRGKIVLSVA